MWACTLDGVSVRPEWAKVRSLAPILGVTVSSPHPPTPAVSRGSNPKCLQEGPSPTYGQVQTLWAPHLSGSKGTYWEDTRIGVKVRREGAQGEQKQHWGPRVD